MRVMIYLWVIKLDLRRGWSKQIMIIRRFAHKAIIESHTCSHQGACNPLGLQHIHGTKEMKQLFDSIAERGVLRPLRCMKWDPRRLLGVKGLAHNRQKKIIQFIKLHSDESFIYTRSPRCTAHTEQIYFQKAYNFFIPCNWCW